MLFSNFHILHILAIVLILYTVFFWTFNFDRNARWMTYLSDLGLIAALFGFILSQLEQIRQRQQEELTEFNQQQEAGFVEIERLFMKYYPDLLPFYKELNFQNLAIQAVPNPPNIDPLKKAQLESNMFNIIVQRIENIFIAYETYEYFQESPWFQEWMQTWRHWFKSPTMQRLWKFNKNTFFSPKTVNFIDSHIIQSNGFLNPPK